MSGLNDKIRAHLETLNAPSFPMAVALAINEPAHRVRNALSTMKNAGLVKYDKATGYSGGGRRPMSRKEAALLGGHARASQFTPKPVKPKSISLTPRRPSVIEPSAIKEVLPCTETWLAANPDKLVRLPAGQWSQPLRFEY